MRAIVPSWEKRLWEYRLPGDSVFRDALQREGIVLIDWRQVKELRRV